ncbi:hypothetical protein Tco_0964059 [Tanacetum coccineum]
MRRIGRCGIRRIGDFLDIDLVSFVVFCEVQAQIRRIFLNGYGVLVVRTIKGEVNHNLAMLPMIGDRISLEEKSCADQEPYIDKDENHVLGLSIVAIAKKFKELIQKDELTIVDFKGAGLERLKVQYNNDVELEYHVSQLKVAVLSETQWNNLSTEEKCTTSITKHYAARYYKEGIEDRIPERWSKKVRRYHFEALNDLRIKSVVRIDVKKKWGYGFLTSIVVRRSNYKMYEFSYADLPRLSVNDVEDMYLLQVQDKLHHLPLEFVKDFNNSLLMFIRRTVIKNIVEDIQIGVESYQRTLNLTKPTMFFEGIDQRIPFTMTPTHKGSSREMLKKIDEVLGHREQLRRLEEYVGGRPKTVNPHTFVRPL